MHDFLIALAFIGMVIAPAIVAGIVSRDSPDLRLNGVVIFMLNCVLLAL